MTALEFVKKVKDDEEFRAKLQEADKNGTVEEFFKQNGSEINKENLKVAYDKLTEELSDEELKSGLDKGGLTCPLDGHCGFTCESDWW